MRQGELLRRRSEHIDLNRRIAHLPCTKNGDARTVPLSTTAVAVLPAVPRALHGDVFPTRREARVYVTVHRVAANNVDYITRAACGPGAEKSKK